MIDKGIVLLLSVFGGAYLLIGSFLGWLIGAVGMAWLAVLVLWPILLMGGIMIATGQCCGEGFDLPAVSTLVLATPMRWSGRGRSIAPISRTKLTRATSNLLNHLSYPDRPAGLFN